MSEFVDDGEQPGTSKQRHHKYASRDGKSTNSSRDIKSKSRDFKNDSRDVKNSKRRSKSPETPHYFKPSSEHSRKRTQSSSSLSGSHHIDFSSSFDGSDVTFKVQGKRVHAVSAVLKVASREFGELIEQQGNVVDLGSNAIEHEDFCELMEMLHPIAGKTKHVNGDNVYRLLPLIRLFDMSALQGECEEFLMTLPPELRQLAIASEYNFDNLEGRVIEWAANRTYRDLENDPDWGLVTTRQRRYILEKLVRKYEHTMEEGRSRGVCESTNTGQDTQLIQAILDENESLRRQQSQEKINEKTMEQLQKELQRSKITSDEVYKKCERYKGIVKKIQDITRGKVSSKSLQLQCKSKALDKHFSGSEDKCSTCRSYMITQIKQLLDDT